MKMINVCFVCCFCSDFVISVICEHCIFEGRHLHACSVDMLIL